MNHCSRVSLASLLLFGLLSLNPSTASASKILVDFGATPTGSPDVNGNHWNPVNGPVNDDLVDDSGVPTMIDLDTITGFASGSNGGLTNPSPALLGDIAIADATRDYWFTANSTTSFALRDLDPAKRYDLRVFATRTTSDSDPRNTEYTVTGGGGPLVQVLDTSGLGSGSGANPFGNDDTILSFPGVTPDASNEITVSFTNGPLGIFGYIGVLEIKEIPEPASMALCLPALLLGLRRRRQA